MKRGQLHIKETLSDELTLQFYKEEIADLLTQLSHALDNSNGKSFISEAEYFLDQLIITDDAVNEMRNKTKEFQTLKSLHNFNKEIKLLGKNISSLRDEFHHAFPSSQYDQKAA
jgi:hypothetical protein